MGGGLRNARIRHSRSPHHPIDYADAAEAVPHPPNHHQRLRRLLPVLPHRPHHHPQERVRPRPHPADQTPRRARHLVVGAAAAVALRALWITNSSNLTLDRGSFSIVENGSFGGEGLLDPIHPSERRLLSYAADQAVRVTPTNDHNSRTVFSTSASPKGVLTQRITFVEERSYTIRNAAPDARTVVIESPVTPLATGPRQHPEPRRNHPHRPPLQSTGRIQPSPSTST